MATFIKRNQIQDTIQTKDGPTTIIRQKNWKTAELLELYRDNPGMFFEVTESHAQDVLRPQNFYQEVYPEVMAEIRVHLAEPDPAPKPTRVRRTAVKEGENNG